MALELSQLMAQRVTCPQPPRQVADGGRKALRHRIYNVSQESDLHIVWQQSFRAYESEVPLSIDSAGLCSHLSKQQWPFCRYHRSGGFRSESQSSTEEAADAAVRAAAVSSLDRSSSPRRRNTLLLVSMPCAFTDGGSNFRGALYDAKRILNAQHRSATPRFSTGPIRRYAIAAVGLTPYGHLADAHFYASTAAWILTLLHLLPPSVPILAARSRRLDSLYAQLGVADGRLHALPPGGAAYADRLLSLVTLPHGALEPLGGSALKRVRARLLPSHLPPLPPLERNVVVYLSRRAQHPRRSVSNRAALLSTLRAALESPRPSESGGGARRQHELEVFEAAGHGPHAATLSETAARFRRTALLVGPHGGAFLNAIYCTPGTPLVEIGYTRASPMAYPSYYHTMARRLGLPFWVVLGEGAYDRPIRAPVHEVVALVSALLRRRP
jgi:hypothetical protein